MTLYQRKSFTVPASGKRQGECLHQWIDKRGRCVLCGEKINKPEQSICIANQE